MSEDDHRLQRADIATALVITAGVGGALTFAAREFLRIRGASTFPLPTVAVYGNYSMAFVAGGTALVIGWLVRGHIGARWLAIHLAFISVTAGLMLNAAGEIGESQRVIGVLGGAFALPALIHFTLRFPEVLRPDHIQTRLLVRIRRGSALHPQLVWLVYLPYGIAIYLLHRVHGLPYSLAMPDMTRGIVRMTVLGLAPWMIGGPVVAGLNLRDGFLASTPEAQRRVLWVVQGYLIGAVPGVLAVTVGMIATAVGSTRGFNIASWIWLTGLPLATLILSVCLLVAVFGSGAFNPSASVRRTATYGVVALVLTCLFAGIEELLSASVFERFGLSEALTTWIGAGIIAIALSPIRNWVDRLVRAMGMDADPASISDRTGADQQDSAV